MPNSLITLETDNVKDNMQELINMTVSDYQFHEDFPKIYVTEDIETGNQWFGIIAKKNSSRTWKVFLVNVEFQNFHTVKERRRLYTYKNENIKSKFHSPTKIIPEETLSKEDLILLWNFCVETLENDESA